MTKEPGDDVIEREARVRAGKLSPTLGNEMLD